jgi:glycosyltransferase involved in cell wall biosynthesis
MKRSLHQHTRELREKMSLPLTVLIPCKNEANNILGCIRSVKTIADEILVADSGSTDGTLELAQASGVCRVIEREYVSYGDFNNWAIPQATHRWILLLDADERLTPPLAKEIKQELRAPRHAGYWMNRLNHFMGHPIRHGAWCPDRQLRLFQRDAGQFVGPSDHARYQVLRGTVGRLTQSFDHYTVWSYEQYLPKLQRYADVQSRIWMEQGRSASFWQLLLRGPLRFLQCYFWKRGCLDGLPGLQIAVLTAYQSFLKQAKLWELQHARQQVDVHTESTTDLTNDFGETSESPQPGVLSSSTPVAVD